MKNKTTTAKNSAPEPYFAITTDEEARSADIYIFGDIASNKGGLGKLLQSRSDQSSYDLAHQVACIPEDYEIVVHINSNGGEVKEGLAIYNTLKTRNVTTICEGFAASAASVIFCAGQKRIMQRASLLFIHQASMIASGNSEDFKKASEDLEIITSTAMSAYIECGLNIGEETLKEMMKRETWITPEDALSLGFATEIADAEETEEPQNDAMQSIMRALTKGRVTTRFEIGFEDGVKESLAEIFESAGQYAEFFEMFNKVATEIKKDPELSNRIKEFALSFLTTNPTPNPAKVENKGFFNFK